MKICRIFYYELFCCSSVVQALDLHQSFQLWMRKLKVNISDFLQFLQVHAVLFASKKVIQN